MGQKRLLFLSCPTICKSHFILSHKTILCGFLMGQKSMHFLSCHIVSKFQSILSHKTLSSSPSHGTKTNAFFILPHHLQILLHFAPRSRLIIKATGIALILMSKTCRILHIQFFFGSARLPPMLICTAALHQCLHRCLTTIAIPHPSMSSAPRM